MATQSAQITLLQSQTIYVPNLTSYQVSLEVTSSTNIISTVFVKQRLRTPPGNSTDIFAAIATPQQLETLGQYAPTNDTSFFLDSKVCLTARTVEYLNDVVNEILQQLQDLTIDVELIQNTFQSSVYTITSGDIQVNTYTSNTLYRLPLIALPCGIPVDTDGIITIPTAEPTWQGWLPTLDSDPSGYYFKYNISVDPNLPLIYPAAVPKLASAYIERNGVVLDDGTVYLTANGIYWNTNAYGMTPWASDYISPMSPGGLTGATQVILILSINV